MQGRMFARSFLVAVWVGMVASCGGDSGTGPEKETDPPPPSNNSPEAGIAASTTSGYAPLRVFFGGGGSDSDGVIVRIEWDFNGDGTFDQTLNVNAADTSMGTEYTYTQAGTFPATIRVTDDDGATATATQAITVQTTVFSGFEDLSLKSGGYWEYSWVRTNTTNLNSGTTTSGTVRITLGYSLTLNNGLKLYSASITESGDPFPLAAPLEQYGFVGIKDGVLYKARNVEGTNSYEYWVVFDSRAGAVGQRGMMDYFTDKVQETFSNGMIANRFFATTGVTVSELNNKPYCQTVAGVQICDDEAWTFLNQEYYLPNVGFGGFYRSGTYNWSSPFPGGSSSHTILLGLTSTNM